MTPRCKDNLERTSDLRPQEDSDTQMQWQPRKKVRQKKHIKTVAPKCDGSLDRRSDLNQMKTVTTKCNGNLERRSDLKPNKNSDTQM